MNDWYGRKIESADDLAQAWTDRHAERLAGFIRDIILATAAKHMGPGALEHAGQHAPGWSRQTINRLAELSRMPEGVITNPETPLGVFWLILQNTVPGDETPAVMRRAQAEGWNIPKCKKELGLKEEREPPIIAPTEADLVSIEQYGDKYRATFEIPGPAPFLSGTIPVKVKAW